MEKNIFVILLGLLIMVTAFVSTSAISSNPKKQQANLSKTSESSTSSTESSVATQSSFLSNEFQYPNSSTVASTQNELHLSSSDSPKIITDWYKQKLTSLNYSTTNFVATSNNDSIKNMLQAVGEKKVSVEISRDHGESLTDIKVEFN